jgi:hypothetical protein
MSRTDDLIEANADSPVDTLLRLIAETCTDLWDPLEGAVHPSELLPLWYNLDELHLRFTLPNGRRTYVYLVHQGSHAQPSAEDLADYGMSLESVPAFRDLLNRELFYY